MSIRSVDYAFLANDAYHDREPLEKVTLNGVNYLTLAVANDPSGYQATAYQRVDTGEVIIANRGTEFFKEPYRDVIKADGGMVQTGLNKQLDDAMVFANQVRGIVHELKKRQHHPIEITVTGHSLGGTLAEILSYRFGFHGETFNAYGAAGLAYGIPEGGNRIINNVVATDAVSAASAHFGEVRIYASAQNVADMEKAGYGLGAFPRSDANPLIATGVQAHLMKNFLTGESIMTPINAALYRANHVGIDQLRATIMEDRKVLSGEWALQGKMTPEEVANRKIHIESQLDASLKQGMADTAAGGIDGINHIAHRMGYAVTGVAQRVGYEATQSVSHAYDTTKDTTHNEYTTLMQTLDDVIERTTQREKEWPLPDKAASMYSPMQHAPLAPLEPLKTLAPPRLDEITHPDHALFLQARDGVHKLDAAHHRIPDQRSDQLAAALVVAARRDGLVRIDEVTLHRDTESVSARENALPGTDWTTAYLHWPKIGTAPTVRSLNTPIEHSSQAWERTMQQKQAEQAQLELQRQMPLQQPVQPAPSQGRSR